jgi:hypothetical protein
MAVERIFHCVGLSDEDSAHLRLLLRAAKAHLRDGWSWGLEGKADVVIVDARRLIGESAKRRAHQRDVPCAQVIDPRDAMPTGLFLRRPMKREALVALLNGVSEGNVTTVGPVSAWGDDEFDFDIGTIDLSALEARHPGQHDVGAHRIDPDQVAAAAKVTAVELAIDLSRMPSLQMSDDGPMASASTNGEETAPAKALEEDDFETIDPKASYTLLDFLERRLLRVPSRVSLPGTPTLAIDPRRQVFLTQGSLSAMEPYARRSWHPGDWEPLSAAEAGGLERSSFTKPWVALVWMYHFIHSRGLLSKKFNPTGEFRLLNRFNVVVEYPLVHRVGSQLVAPRKLHEVARLSRVDIDLVYDVINAYDAVGYVEGTLRK